MGNETQRKVAVVAGAGPGLGLSLARRFAREGYRVAMMARHPDRLGALAGEVNAQFARSADAVAALPIACNLSDPAAVAGAFALVDRELGSPACVIFNAGAFRPGSVLDITPQDFEDCWKTGCFAGFLVGREAARRMADRGGSILFTGATASLRGGARFANLASPKFALRALAQSMARELGPRGVHVAHVVIDGMIGTAPDGAAPDSRLAPDDIAEGYWQLHVQPRSAWTLELDLRPWVEKF